MVKLQNLKVRSQLILLGSTAIIGFIVFGLMSFYTIAKIKVNGPMYKNVVQGKDLIADILPPPEYIIESYLTILQIVNESNVANKKELIEKFKQLQKDFKERHEFWQKDLPESPMKEIITKKSFIPAMAFYEKAEKELFPAVIGNDSSRARKVVLEMKKDYETHRQAIDELVKMANERNADDEVAAAKIIHNETVMLIIIMCITIAATVAIAYLIAHNLLYALGGEPHFIEDIAKKISAGDLTKSFSSNGKAETGVYAAMKEMAEKLKKVVAETKSAADNLASASHELSASSEQMSRGVSEQAGRSSQIATASTQMSQTVIDVAKTSSNIASSATETVKVAGEGEEIVNKSVQEVKAIAETVNESSKLMASLGERSKQIGEIVNVIKDIADQTNLLALNAAIEAARAGEQGRGFAVVADEVRKLAERTGKATSEISEMINAIQDEMEKAVVSMEDGTKRVEIGVEFSAQAGEALRKIVGSVGELQSMVQQIATATEEMSTASEQISGDIETIANVSKETSISSDQVAQASSDLAGLASGLQNTVGLFKV